MAAPSQKQSIMRTLNRFRAAATVAAAWLLVCHNAHAAILEAVEFYNTPIKHYFVTTSASEATGIDGGAAGAGWSRTGGKFFVYSTQAEGIAGKTVPVCRFYARGPNSHFFTANQAECDNLRAIEAQQRQSAGAAFQGWGFEGVAFYAVSATNGACPTGFTPVYRFYNQRGEQNDSNHRFTTDAAAGASLVSLGWKAEGVAFCGVATTITPPPSGAGGDVNCDAFYPTTSKILTFQTSSSATNPSGVVENTSSRSISRNVGATRFEGQDAIAIRGTIEGVSGSFTETIIALSDSEVTWLASRTETGGVAYDQKNSPPVVLPRKWTIGQAVTNTHQLLTSYGGVASGSISRTITDTLLRRETVTTPAGTFPDACVIRSTFRFPTEGSESVSDHWLVPGLGSVKSRYVSSAGVNNAGVTSVSSETILVSIQ
jgi:Repeat of unknown function (DUF5648)